MAATCTPDCGIYLNDNFGIAANWVLSTAPKNKDYVTIRSNANGNYLVATTTETGMWVLFYVSVLVACCVAVTISYDLKGSSSRKMLLEQFCTN